MQEADRGSERPSVASITGTLTQLARATCQAWGCDGERRDVAAMGLSGEGVEMEK